MFWTFPLGPVVKTSPANEGRGGGAGSGSIPGQGPKIPHASQPKKPKHKTEAILLPKNTLKMGLPWWLRGKESASQCRWHGFHPWSRRPHMLSGSEAHAPQLRNLCSRSQEPQLLKPTWPRACAPQQKPPQ